MIQLLNKRLLALLCMMIPVLLFTSCEKDEDGAGADKIQLLSFGPTGAQHGDTLRFIGIHLDKVTAIEFTGGAAAAVDKAAFKSQSSGLIKVLVPEAAEKGYVTLKTPEGDIVTKTQLNLGVTIQVTTITAQARPGSNITIAGNYLNWVDRVTFANNKPVETFVSQTINELVVKVPDDAQSGTLLISYQGTDPAEMETTQTVNVTLPLITAMAPLPVKPLTNLTITGTDLDLAKKVLFNGVTNPVTTFVSQSATQLVVAVPETAKTGKLTLEAASGVQTVSTPDLTIVVPAITNFSPASINIGSNLTITGTNLDLVKKVIFTGVAPAVTTFVSQSATQLVVAVPAGSRDGTIRVEAASGVQAASTGSLDVILPSVTTMSPNPVFPSTNLTITGTLLNMVNAITFENAPAVTSFVSQSATQIVVTVPNGVLRGKIILRTQAPSDTVQSRDILEIAGGVPPPTIALPIYDDAVTANWNGWTGGGWGGTADYNNASPVRAGTKSIKVDYTGQWGAPIQLGAGTVNVSAYTTFKISIFGAPGSAGKKVSIAINGVDAYTINVTEGAWTDYSIPISTLTSSSTITEILVKEYSGGTFSNFTVYVDAMGFN
ncbi:MAG: IPT/TIG domain-containing protein [Chitinophagaceae bacterium]